MSTHEEQIVILTEKLGILENESRRILAALHWSSRVRTVLFFGLMLFALISTFLFYRLYVDVKTNRIAEVQRIIREHPEKFSEPLTRQVMFLAEEQGPFVIEAFRKQAQEDSALYLNAFDTERATLINNLQANLEEKLNDSYATMLAEQEEMLKAEFPVLKDPDKLDNIRTNMEKVYDKIGKRYFVDSLREELESIANKIDTFPAAEPKVDNIPLGEQIATELLELVRLMLVNSENYIVPTSTERSDAAQSMSVEKAKGPSSVSLDLESSGLAKPPKPDEPADETTEGKNSVDDSSPSTKGKSDESSSADTIKTKGNDEPDE